MIDVNTIFPCESSEEERERGVIDVLFLSLVGLFVTENMLFKRLFFTIYVRKEPKYIVDASERAERFACPISYGSEGLHARCRRRPT